MTGCLSLWLKLITYDGFLSRHLCWRDFYPCDLNLRVFIIKLGFLTSSFILTEVLILASSFQFKGNCSPWNDFPLSIMKAVLQTSGLLYSSLLIKIGYKDINLWKHKSATDKVLNRKWNKCIMKLIRVESSPLLIDSTSWGVLHSMDVAKVFPSPLLDSSYPFLNNGRPCMGLPSWGLVSL